MKELISTLFFDKEWKFISRNIQNKEVINFLEEKYPHLSRKEQVYLYLQNLSKKPICQFCKKELTLKNYKKGFPSYCSRSCLNSDPRRTEKIKNTLIERYGDHPMRINSFKEKLVKTNIKKYGKKNYAQTQEYKEKTKESNKKKYGVEWSFQNEEVKNKGKKTMNQKYGVSSPLQNQEILGRTKETNKVLYGSNSPLGNKEIQNKKKKTFLQKYGFDNPMKNKEVISKMRKTNKEKYGKEQYTQTDQYKEKTIRAYIERDYENIKKFLEDNSFEILTKEDLVKKTQEKKLEYTCKKCHNKIPVEKGYYYHIRCLQCYPKKRTRAEVEIREYLEILGIKKEEILENKRNIIKGKELDLYIPRLQLAIEYNGLIFHSFWVSQYSLLNNSQTEKLQKQNHLLKTHECEELGIELLHIFENEWCDIKKRNIWKSIISTKLGKNQKIYARETKIREVDAKEANIFLDENHLQGRDNNSSIKIGLFQNEELVSLMTFWKSRYNKDSTWELYRYVSKKEVSVIGGASKLIKFFESNFIEKGNTLITYADRRYSQGNLYRKLGFEYKGFTHPNYFYFKENTFWPLRSRISFQKHKLKEKLELFDPKKTESENMYENGYRKIYDSGNHIFQKSF